AWGFGVLGTSSVRMVYCGAGGVVENSLLLGITTAVPGNISFSFQSFAAPFKSKKRLEGLNLIWQSVMWSLWLARNSLIFQGVKLKTCEIVDAIKHRSLHWFVASRYGGVCVLYEWEKLPLICLLR
ncbi:hypothetical protein L195_g043138, partial [Trifolium pratense]